MIGGDAEVWRRGPVVSSWLLDLTAQALAPALSNYTGIVQDSGEGRWTVIAAIEAGVPVDVLSVSLFTRFRSRQEHTFGEKVLSAMRAKFGGHVEPAAGERSSSGGGAILVHGGAMRGGEEGADEVPRAVE
jgi:6-phosphogluconate dehydrogenase